MKKHLKFLVRIIAFSIMASLLILISNYILTPKFYYNSTWPNTSTYRGFYLMPQDSIDILFLGSSHAVSAFNPQVLYNHYNIKSYNLGSEEQNLLITYYWLKEALRFQSPKVVIIDTYMVFEYASYEPLNSSEVSCRKAIDYMKWSKVKCDAVRDICLLDKNQSLLSYYLPNIRYHTRWMDLDENDFMYHLSENSYALKGYAPLCNKISDDTYTPFMDGSSDEYADMVPLMREYLDKIVELCNNENIQLILVKTPTTAENIAKYNTLCEYATQNNILFWDFNEKDIYNNCRFSFPDDMNDYGHENIWGAEKISLYCASILHDELDIAGDGYFQEKWQKTDLFYQSILCDCNMPYIQDIIDYIEALKQKHYVVFITVRGYADFLTDELLEKFRELGLKMDISSCESYYAVIHGDDILEESGKDELVHYGNVNNHLYRIVSSGYYQSKVDKASVIIDDKEYCVNKVGLNIVVYNIETNKVVNSICYDGSFRE